MDQTLQVEISKQAFAAVQREAEAAGVDIAYLAAIAIEQRYAPSSAGGTLRPRHFRTKKKRYTEKEAAAKAAFEQQFGTVVPESDDCLDNEKIDADLAREYASAHE